MLAHKLSLVAPALAVVLLGSCSVSDNSKSSYSPPSSNTADDRQEAAFPPECVLEPGESGASDGVGELGNPEQAPVDGESFSSDLAIEFTTSQGDFLIELDPKRAPCTTQSMVGLSQRGYFDGTSCHRLTTKDIFVLQCGDPTASGEGGPGYSLPDEFDGSEKYPPGTVAMANIPGRENSGGSQFFIVYQSGSLKLPPIFTVLGTLNKKSLRNVRAVAAAGTANGRPDSRPMLETKILKSTVINSGGS